MRTHFPWREFGYAAGVVGVLLALHAGVRYATVHANPLDDAIPVSELPPDAVGPSRDGLTLIPLSALRRTPVHPHLVGPGDTLGIWIDGILGEKDRRPDTLSPRNFEVDPDVGYPCIVAEDGDLDLPCVPPFHVDKKSLAEIRDLIREAYSGGKNPILAKGDEQIFVSLIQPRKVRVRVIREDVKIVAASGARSTGVQTLELPVDESDLFSALNLTGGMPGFDAQNEVVIERSIPGEGTKIIRIPTLVPLGEIPFSQSDVILENGDIVCVWGRDDEVYYTGGLLPTKQMMLPRDYDLHAVEVVAISMGPIPAPAGLGSSSPSQLTVIRRTTSHGLITIRVDLNLARLDPRENLVIQPGDFLVLQERVGENFTFVGAWDCLLSMFSGSMP